MNSEQQFETKLAKSGASPALHSVHEHESSEEMEGELAIDVFQTKDDIVVRSPIAGVGAEDVDIDVTSDSVTIHGSRSQEHEVHEDDFLYKECYWGKFSRSISLSHEVDADNADASLKRGVLTVRIPKLKKQKGKKVRVKSE